MPCYRVRCSTCGREEEVLYRSIAAADVLRERGLPCPVAGCGGTLRTVPAVPSVRFKGQGWQTPSPSGGVKS